LNPARHHLDSIVIHALNVMLLFLLLLWTTKRVGPSEKNDHSAYYWLRMAEETSSAVRQRSRALTEDLRTKINPAEIEGLERRIAIGEKNDKILAIEPVELFKQRLPLLTDRQAV
jgi:hypothetical protein